MPALLHPTADRPTIQYSRTSADFVRVLSFSFNLNGQGLCTASESAFTGTDASGASYKKLPNIGVTYCQTTTWSATRSADGGFTIAAKNDAGLTGTSPLPATDFTVADGVETYTGAGIVILYGPSLP